MFRKPQHHVAAGRCPPAFDEAQVFLGNLRIKRKIELGQAAALAPAANMLTRSSGSWSIQRVYHHGPMLALWAGNPITSQLIDLRRIFHDVLPRQHQQQENMMSVSFQPTRFLRYALIGDALASGATGLLMAAGAGFLTGLLNLPEELMRYAGMFLLPYAVIVAYVGTRPEVSKAAVWTIIALNALWAVESIGLLIGSWVAPTMLGYAFVIFQAVVVLAFAEAQYMGLRQARTAVAQAQ